MLSRAALLGVLLCGGLISLTCSQNPEDDKIIDGILKKMTLQQKIGQMLLPYYQEILKSGSPDVDVQKLKDSWREFGLGTAYGPRPVFVHDGKSGGLCTDWQKLTSTAQAAFVGAGGPPILFGLCSQHGANYIANATIFPHNIAAGATFDPELIELAGRVTGKDSRTCGLAWAISPAIDTALEPLWARNYECFSSDPYISAVMADAIVRGIEWRNSPFFTSGRAQAATIVKHFIGYSNPDSGGDRQDATVPDWMMERFHLPSFRSAFAAGAMAVMFNSGSVNKVPGHANPKLTVDLLRNKLNFTGVAVSDYDDVNKLVSTHKIASSFSDAVKLAMNAGLDVTMIPGQWAPTLLNLVQSGQVTEARVTESARRILQLKMKLGLFEANGPFLELTSTVGQTQDRLLALRMAEESITLLKNENSTLPILLDSTSAPKKILVTGPCGNSIRLQSGGWTILWGGANNDAEFYGHGSTFFQGINSIAQPAGWSVSFVEGAGFDAITDLQTALTLAKDADYTIVCLGEKPYAEFTYDIPSLDLQKAQLDYVAELRRVSQKLILVLAQGRPRTFKRVIPLADAIVYTYLPGPYGGPALANLIFGKTNPSGRLPMPYPSAGRQFSLQYGRWKHVPEWPLGFGLSYTSYEYSALVVPPVFQLSSVSPTLTVSVVVKNIGQMAGKETVILWLSDYFAYPTPELVMMPRRFIKVALDPQEATKISFDLNVADFRYLLEPASQQPLLLTVQVGPLTVNITFAATGVPAVDLKVPDPLPRDTIRVENLAAPSPSQATQPAQQSPQVGTPSATPVALAPSSRNPPRQGVESSASAWRDSWLATLSGFFAWFGLCLLIFDHFPGVPYVMAI